MKKVEFPLTALNAVFELSTPSDIDSDAKSYTYVKFGAFVRSANDMTLRDLTNMGMHLITGKYSSGSCCTANHPQKQILNFLPVSCPSRRIDVDSTSWSTSISGRKCKSNRRQEIDVENEVEFRSKTQTESTLIYQRQETNVEATSISSQKRKSN